MVWSQLLPQLPYLLVAVLMPAVSLRMTGPRTRAWMLEALGRMGLMGLALRAMLWLSDRLLCWLPNFEEWDERLDRQAETARSSSASSASPASPAHRHVMLLVRRENVVNAECTDCRFSAPVRPSRRARRNVIVLERWLDRLDSRLQRDTPASP